MNISASINALNNVAASFNEMPERIQDSMHNPEAKQGLENVFTDMLVGENIFAANVKTIQTMNTVEDILLNELRT